MDFNNLNPMQRQAVENLNGPLLIIAGAGSGKTRTMTFRIAHLMEQGVSPYSILALTFTNKAAKEMLSRVEELATKPSRLGLAPSTPSACGCFGGILKSWATSAPLSFTMMMTRCAS